MKYLNVFATGSQSVSKLWTVLMAYGGTSVSFSAEVYAAKALLEEGTSVAAGILEPSDLCVVAARRGGGCQH